jgi:hypothetical protein
MDVRTARLTLKITPTHRKFNRINSRKQNMKRSRAGIGTHSRTAPRNVGSMTSHGDAIVTATRALAGLSLRRFWTNGATGFRTNDSFREL